MKHKRLIHIHQVDNTGKILLIVSSIVFLLVAGGVALYFLLLGDVKSGFTNAPSLPAGTTEVPFTYIPLSDPPIIPGTFPPNAIKLFIKDKLAGDFGDRSTTSGACAAKATAIGLTCPSGAIALLSYTGDRIEDIPTTYSIDGNRPLWLYNNPVELSPTFAEAITTGQLGNKLATTLESANILLLPGNTDVTSYGTGFNSFGSPNALENCSDWTSNSSGTGVIGFKYSLDYNWLEVETKGCGSVNNYLCICY